MSILNNIPTKLLDICAVDFTICRDEHEWYIDFNTGMKSHLYLYYVNGEYVARCRYGVEKIIKTFDDFHDVLVSCEHGKGFMNSDWATIFHEGFGEFSWNRIADEKQDEIN